jgi:hypothetical protein
MTARQPDPILLTMNSERKYTTSPPEGFDAARARLNAWKTFSHHSYAEHQAHEADLRLMPVDDGTAGPVWEVSP